MSRKARTSKETVEFLFANAFKREDGCLICHLMPGSGGYVQLNVQGRIINAHVFIHEECIGPLNQGQIVRHNCDTRDCINPDHLSAGTQQDNMDDMKQRGRRGTHKSYFREAILAEKAKGLSYTEIAQKLMLPYNTVRNHASPFGQYNQEDTNA